MRKSVTILLLVFAYLVLPPHPLPAQWLNYRSPSTPRTPDGKPNLTAPAPRALDGHPDLSGVWHIEPTPAAELTQMYGDNSAVSVPGDDFYSLSKYTVNFFADFKPGEEPFRPDYTWRRSPPTANPTARCLPAGIPFGQLLPAPFKIVQTPALTLFLRNEVDGTVRQIYTDGRKVPADPEPLWLGYSVGRWDAGTFVVDTTGFNDKSWFDAFGHPHSEALHVTERYHRRDFGHMEARITIEDPRTYTKPVTIQVMYLLIPDTDVLDSYCTENEKDNPHLH